MLYDPKWNETKADPLSLPAFAAWLEKQPQSKAYCYTDNGKCLAAHWLRHLGYTSVHVGACGKWKAHGAEGTLPIVARIAIKFPWTFGAALTRVRARSG